MTQDRHRPFVLDENTEPTDMLLTCVDCGKSFVFYIGEQIFFSDKGFPLPGRCPACRDARKRAIHKGVR